VNFQDINFDHFIPLSKGGKNTIQNLVLSCSTCNVMKADQLTRDFFSNIKQIALYNRLFDVNSLTSEDEKRG
jgi:5-methylcytosine-specific restriction endonuclease McrA